MPSFYVGSNFYVKEIKGKYYVYIIEKDKDGKQRHHYVGPLEKIIELALGVLGGVPLSKVAGPGFEPGSPGPEPGILDR